MKDLLVGTVLAKDDEAQRQWLGLQLRWLAATTKDYDHQTVIMEGVEGAPDDRTQFLEPQDKTKKFHEAHLLGLKILVESFKQKREEYRNFLILDSDAFPIQKDWLPSLLKELGSEGFFDNSGMAITGLNKKTYEIAIALRSENLEQRLHASVLFIRKPFLDNVRFEVGDVGCDLLGGRESDIHLPHYEEMKGRKRAFPLIRTNQYNFHPLCCGVYFNMFYHHGSGSRKYNMRGIDYWDDAVPEVCEVHDLADGLFRNPEKFIWQLAGWSPDRYPDKV